MKAGVCGLAELSVESSVSVVPFDVDGERWPCACVDEASRLVRVDVDAGGWKETGRGLAGRPGLNMGRGTFRSAGEKGVEREVW